MQLNHGWTRMNTDKMSGLASAPLPKIASPLGERRAFREIFSAAVLSVRIGIHPWFSTAWFGL